MANPEVATQQSLFAIAAGKTDVGRRRDHNEDQILLNDDLGLYAVADGMGGHQAGDVASSIAAASLEEFFWRSEGETHIEGLEELPEGARRLAAAVHFCNQEVFARSGRSANQGGMGSTIVAIHLDPEEPLVHIAHVGDSRCYRIRNGEIEQLTRDHSMINEALRLNPDLSEEILKQLPSNVVTRALGTKEDVLPDIRTEPMVVGDVYLLCSDGLSGEVSDEDLRFGVLQSDSAADVAELLVAMANEAGGRDNISALVVRIADGEDGAHLREPQSFVVVGDDDDEVALTIEDDDDLEEEEVELEDDFDEDSYAGDDPAERITATPAGDDEVAEDDEILDELEEEAESLDEDLDEDLDEEEYLDDEEEEPEDGEEAAPLELLLVVAKPEPPRRGSSHPPRRRASLADLEPPFGSLATVADPTLVAELPPIDDDNPYAAALTSAREMTTDALHAPASAVVGLGKEEGEEPPQEAAALRRLCIVCGHRLLAEEQFCGMCGTSTAVEDDLPVCEACGSNIYPDTSFCVECGVQHGIEWY